MRSTRTIRNLIILTIVLVDVGCDQVTKTIVRKGINYNENIGFIDNHLTLTKVENSGAFLSFGDSMPAALKLLILSILPVIALASGMYFLLTRATISRLLITGLCFVIGGGLGNIYDRLRYGSVTDFLHIDLVIFQTGVFNMADVSIMFGIFMILVHLYFQKIQIKPSESI